MDRVYLLCLSSSMLMGQPMAAVATLVAVLVLSVGIFVHNFHPISVAICPASTVNK